MSDSKAELTGSRPDSSGKPDRTAGPKSEPADQSPAGENARPKTNVGGSESGSSPARADLTERSLGEFRLLRLLGRGGMAEVYLAEQTSLHRRVAVKVLRAELLTDDTHVKRFEREARAAAGLTHPNIVQVYSIGESDGIHYIAQEYVQGVNLQEFLKRKGPPELSAALHIMRQVAAALQTAADAGIVHRDIKPENIMMTRKGEVKVADFGLAQLAQTGDQLQLTQVGMTMGTPLYMSPEQVNGKPLDQRSDIYSFGVTCYHMLAGRPPFRGETALGVAVKHVNEEPDPLTDERPDLPRALCELVHKMMAKEPQGRYPDARSVVRDLRQIARAVKEQPEEALKRSLSSFQAPRERQSLAARFFGWSGRKQVIAFIVAFLLTGSLAAGVGWLLRPGDPFQTPAKPATTPRLDTPGKQFARAVMLVDDEDAWKAVGENFPGDTFYVPRAQQQLAALYLQQNKLDKAKVLFDHFVSTAGLDPEYKARGFAGQAVIASLRGEYNESQRIIVDDVLAVNKLLDRQMAELVRQAILRNRQVLGDKVRKDLADLFRREPPNNNNDDE